MPHRIAVIGGDGIGPDVIAEALKVLRAAGADLELTDMDLGGARYLRDGEVLSDEANDARGRARHVTLVHKTNMLVYAGDLWQRAFDDVAAEYPGIRTSYCHVDAACIHLVEDPHRFDVIVTDNLFGDIITDLAGAVSGGIGLAASANLNPDRTSPSMFEPVHGSAPDIAGQNRANPVAAILSAAMMMDFLGDVAVGDRIRAACQHAGPGSTTEIGDRIAAAVAG
ncbi:MAG: hypothetical protein KY395_07280 [Actinobacteria bacterium]|nr:hypothetical protein [Actinomycetota bacterium]